MSTIFGSNTAIRTSSTDSWSQMGSGEFVQVYQAEYSVAETFATALIAALGADAVTLSRDGGMGTVTVRNDSNFTVVPSTSGIWQIEPSDLEKPLESFPGIVGNTNDQFNSVSVAAYIAEAQTEYEKGNLQFDPVDATAQNYFDLRKRGVQAYLRGYVTITWQRTVRKSGISANIDYNGVDRAWKESDPYGPNNMPSSVVGVLSFVPEWDANAKQFLKRWPSIRTDDGRNYTITQTWIWARSWSKLLYDGDETP